MNTLYSLDLLPIISSFKRKLLFGLILTFSLIFISLVISKSVFGQTPTTKISLLDQRVPTQTNIVGIVGGETIPVQVSMSNLTDPNRLAAFTFKIIYKPSLSSLADTNGDGIAETGTVTSGSFLGSSGKQVSCSSPYIDPVKNNTSKKQLSFSCVTLGNTPAAPTGSGTLALVNFKTGNTLGSSILTLNSTELADDTENANLIPHTAVSIPIQIAKCADFDGDRKVRGSDILYVVNKYYTNDTLADLDGNGSVRGADILLAVSEFQRICP